DAGLASTKHARPLAPWLRLIRFAGITARKVRHDAGEPRPVRQVRGRDPAGEPLAAQAPRKRVICRQGTLSAYGSGTLRTDIGIEAYLAVERGHKLLAVLLKVSRKAL